MPTISLPGGFKFENVSKTVVTLWVSVAVLTALLVFVWREAADPMFQLVSAKQATEHVQATMDEFGRHYAETPEVAATLLDDARGKMTVSRYSDGCLLIARSASGRARSKLIVDLVRDPDGAPPKPLGLLEKLFPTLQARGNCFPPLQHPCQLRQDRTCFATWYGERQGCYIQVWRQWLDGCKQWQWFDTCHNTFVGVPTWTNCSH